MNSRFQKTTVIQDDGKVLYRRRNNNRRATVFKGVYHKQSGRYVISVIFRHNLTFLFKYDLHLFVRYHKEPLDMDNRDVLSYSGPLVFIHDCHIYLVVCSGVRMVRYLHKYCFKGNDQLKVKLKRHKKKKETKKESENETTPPPNEIYA